MKYFLILFMTVSVGLSTTNISLADKDQDMEKMKAEYMAKWQEYATPGEGHKVMEQFVGNWDYSLNYWASPDAPPEKSTGTSDIKWILGNRFLEMNVKSTTKNQPFEGMGIIGYDNAKKQYSNVWIDSMGTGMMNATGTYDTETKTMTETGKFTDPLSGEQSFKGCNKIYKPRQLHL